MPAKPPIVLVDDGLGRFGPLTDLRAAFELRTGRDTILERHRRTWGSRLAAVAVPTHLAALVAARIDLPVNALPESERVVLLNGRMAIPDDRAWPVADEMLIGRHPDDAQPAIVAADLRTAVAAALLAGAEPDSSIVRREIDPAALVRRPWDLLDRIDASIRHDLFSASPSAATEPGAGVIVMRGEPLVIDASARICPGAVIDTEHGPVLILERALIRPHAVLCGPCVVGADAVVADHATIRPRTVIGPRCKVGGEVSGCIFQGSSNKVHDGFLGDSFVGEWVNLGAGTVGSNLLNTYGETTIRLTPADQRERTGRQFLGALIGDHVKTAIGTRLMTATSIGLGAMIAASVPPPTTVAPFAWITDEGTRTYRLDKFIESMTRVMARRHDTPSPAMIAAITALHARAG